jgi:hypothetical protein
MGDIRKRSQIYINNTVRCSIHNRYKNYHNQMMEKNDKYFLPRNSNSSGRFSMNYSHIDIMSIYACFLAMMLKRKGIEKML